jgi:hypothetical protein
MIDMGGRGIKGKGKGRIAPEWRVYIKATIARMMMTMMMMGALILFVLIGLKA